MKYVTECAKGIVVFAAVVVMVVICLGTGCSKPATENRGQSAVTAPSDTPVSEHKHVRDFARDFSVDKSVDEQEGFVCGYWSGYFLTKQNYCTTAPALSICQGEAAEVTYDKLKAAWSCGKLSKKIDVCQMVYDERNRFETYLEGALYFCRHRNVPSVCPRIIPADLQTYAKRLYRQVKECNGHMPAMRAYEDGRRAGFTDVRIDFCWLDHTLSICRDKPIKF